MSTTDTRAAFEAAKAKMIDGWTDFDMFEAGHKAATEAAKAEQSTPIALTLAQQIEESNYKRAFMEWSEKTDWVQEQISTFPINAIGKHRADIMREEIERLRAEAAKGKGRYCAHCQREADNECKNCKGYGVVTHISGMTPDNYEECNEVCPDCKGEGTEAAKATGTAGEFDRGAILSIAKAHGFTTTKIMSRGPELIGGNVELHERFMQFGQACAEAARNLAIAQSDYNHDMDELAQDFEPVADMNLEKAKRHIVGLRKRLKNAKAKAEAARQPAPVVAVKTWQERRIDFMKDGAFLHPEDAKDAEIADLRAALAARSQP